LSAGAQPRLQKTEPWELIQAFAEAMDRNTLQQADLRNRREIQEMKESGEDRRLERGSQLALDRLSGELKIKEPYQQRAEERSHGYDVDKMNKRRRDHAPELQGVRCGVRATTPIQPHVRHRAGPHVRTTAARGQEGRPARQGRHRQARSATQERDRSSGRDQAG
jgi:hypothetical protein